MALPINIEDLINGRTIESERIEYKEGFDRLEAMHGICAFANDINNLGGGYLIFGIGENKGLPILPPKGLPISKLNKYQQEINNLIFRIEPTYTPNIEICEFMGKMIMILWVPGGEQRPYKTNKFLSPGSSKHYYIRCGSITRIANTQEQSKLMELSNKIPHDDRVNQNATIQNIDRELVEAYLKRIKSNLYEEVKNLTDVELFRKMGIIRGPDEYLLPLNISLLMFNKNPKQFFTGAHITVVVYDDDEGTSFTEKVFDGPITSQIESVLDYIKNNVIKTKIRKTNVSAEAVRVTNYPYEAIEESLVNAVYHKSYEHQSCIEVNVRTDGIDMLSFPGPIPPINNKMLKREKIIARDYRNRKIGDFLKELHLTEGRGTGFPTIRSSMRKNDSPEPTFETDESNTYFLCVLPIQPEFKPLKLTDYQKVILKCCIEPKTRAELLASIELANIYQNFERHALPLVKSGYLDMTIPNIPKSTKQKYVTSTKGMSILNPL